MLGSYVIVAAVAFLCGFASGMVVIVEWRSPWMCKVRKLLEWEAWRE